LSVYFDASLIVAIFLEDAHNDRADAYLSGARPTATISDFAAAEVAAVIGVRVRRGELDHAGARAAMAEFDAWRSRAAQAYSLRAGDVAAADDLLRRLDFTLRAPDAIHLAIVSGARLQLATFDRRMSECAEALGIETAAI